MPFILKSLTKETLNSVVLEKYNKLKLSLFVFPFSLLLALVVFLYSKNSLSVLNYVEIQKSYFYLINAQLSKFPDLIYNLTQFGDALVFFSLLSPLVVYTPKIWEALLSSSIISCILSRVLKDIFSVPRPAQIYDVTSFKIVGEKLIGFSSLPSGHSITIFSTLTVLLFAFVPNKFYLKIAWTVIFILLGSALSLTRVGVGAHHPLDVFTGGIIGCISGLSGVLMSVKYKIWTWINYKKYYPIFILLFLICGVVLITKINAKNLSIFYFALASLLFSLYKIIYVYTKK
ncbi:phosphatase PAP2 family protein [Flavobacterium succinicans]|uniref:PAP2 superfamily protein n=1 Tax=Flavobacterium succinicans TaxID=29536 RepID=A0A199XNB3_9FLAO|nr:phosphatase PAP2 family protein [Flavobacterium succinicans]OAZ03135.1 PAP2 superfamily protein [Flavobacterium succinicans]